MLLRGDGVCVGAKKRKMDRDILYEIKQLCSFRKVILKIPYE